jgi:hypothetical protein
MWRPQSVHDDRLSDDITAFLAQYALSVGHLDILIFLYEGRARSWSALELSQKMRTNPTMVVNHLNDLGDLIKKTGENDFKFGVDDPQTLDRIVRTADLYRTHKHVIINEIYSRTLGAIRSFADAFKIKKDKK